VSWWKTKKRIVVTCARGISSFVVKELRDLGFPVVSEGMAHIETEGTLEDTMRLNLCLRTAQRVLFLVESFKAKNPDELYRRVSRIGWEDLLPDGEYLCVTSSVETPSIQDSRFANLKCKDAVVDRLKRTRGHRPDSGPERDHTVIHVRWQGEESSIYVDTSGEPLSRRGYRRIPLKAPMQETLAAAVVLATGWEGRSNFINPMCGSGTLVIEAALIGLGRAPGLLRSNFGFLHMKGVEDASWKTLRKKVRAAAKNELGGRIIATDISDRAVEAARKNAVTAGVDRWIEFKTSPFAETLIPDGGGAVVLNPEYGERMGEVEALKATYREIGDFFKRTCQGYRGYIFTGNLDLAKHVGLRTRRRIPFFSSNLECRLLEYELYEGSQKEKGLRPIQPWEPTVG